MELTTNILGIVFVVTVLAIICKSVLDIKITPDSLSINKRRFMEKHIELLGKKAKDLVTGYSGIITTVSFDLYGCVQAVVTPHVDEKGAIKDGNWFDVTRLKIIDEKSVLPLPNFNEGYVAEGKKGCSAKSLP